MREKLQTLPVSVLKEMAKEQGIKGATALRKAELIEELCRAAGENEESRTPNSRPAAVRRTNFNQADQAGQNRSSEQQTGQPAREDGADRLQEEMDSGVPASGILEVMPDGFGFIRCENFLPGENDVYVSPTQIRRFNLKTGDIISGNRRVKTSNEKFAALLYIKNVNGYPLSALERRPNFEELTPVFPNSRLHMETQGKSSTAMRVLDLLAPIGKGQRGMIVSPPKAGKTTLLKCMIGLLSWSSGHSLLNGQYIQQLKAKEIWNTISYIPQTHGFSFSYTGLEMVMMGRSSHLGLFEQPGTKEIEMAEAMMEKTGITHLSSKDCNRMSGGELQMRHL